MFIPMVDTLAAIVDIENYQMAAGSIIELLEEKKNEAKLVAANNASEKVLVKLNNKTFYMLPSGAKGYAYILHNDSYEVKLAQFRSRNEDFFPIFIKIKSEHLWSAGVSKAWNEIVSWLKETVGNITNNKINRMDLCCHTDKLCLDENDIETFQGNYHEDVIHRYRRKVNAVTFGSRNNQKIYCRIYNKSLEVKQKKQKLWFYDIWKNAGLDIDNVWNVEFELDRGIFKDINLETVEDALNNIKSLWEYCTKEWLVKKVRGRTRIERCDVDDTWRQLQYIFSDYKGESLIKREKQLQAGAMALLPSIIGNITSFAARSGISDIDQNIQIIETQGNKYLGRKNKSFEDVVNKKMLLMY